MDAVIYARLSQEDGTIDGPTATARQIADCRVEAERRGWKVIRVYEDPDHSASNPKRKRPAFARMLADLEDSRVDVVLTYKLDRLLRQPSEAETLINTADRRGFGIASLNDPTIDLATPTGRAMFRMTITWAKLETETMSLRIRRKARAIAETGAPNGGGIRNFGLTPDRLAIVPEEAAHIRDAAGRLLTGEKTHSIVADWNIRGIRTPGRKSAPEGRRWEASSFKRMMTAPRIVGDRSHHGVVTGTGIIPAILDRETWTRVLAILNTPRPTAMGPGVRRHWLTGLLFCGLCGTKMIGKPDAHGTTRYTCARPRGCGRIVVAKKNIEPFIADAIAEVIDSPAFHEQLAGEDDTKHDVALLTVDQAALEEAAIAYFVERAIRKEEYLRVRANLADRIDATRRRIERASSSRAARLVGIDIRAEWDRRPVAWQHDVAATLIDRIIVNPAPRRGTRFDPSRIDVEWRA
jgi:DNA invertase Pin-like site-specific DNA recombinase